jgi:hypothetical protein
LVAYAEYRNMLVEIVASASSPDLADPEPIGKIPPGSTLRSERGVVGGAQNSDFADARSLEDGLTGPPADRDVHRGDDRDRADEDQLATGTDLVAKQLALFGGDAE